MDALNEVFQSFQMSGSILYSGRAWGPWGMRLDPQEEQADAAFHVLTKGNCVLEVEGRDGKLLPLLPLTAGDFVLLPHGSRHILRDCAATVARPIAELRQDAWMDENGSLCLGRPGIDGEEESSMVCGRFFLGDSTANPLLRALPTVLRVRVAEDARAVEWLETTLGFTTCEANSGRPGAQTVISRLSDILLIQAVRAYISRAPECEAFGTASDGGVEAGWLRALVDPQVGPVLQAVHRAPETPWTVETLARRAAMSRSAFSARFTHLIGEPPLQYVTRWRVHTAARLLRRDDAPLYRIAEGVGYESEAAFSKVFKRWTGSSPGHYRRQSTIVPLTG